MALQTLNIGTAANDGTGDNLRVGGDKINDNFSEIYTTFGNGSALSSLAVTAINNATANEILTVGATTTELDAEANLTFDGSTLTVTGNITVPNDGDIGSVGATDAIQISSDGIVTFKDDILIKDGGTIGTATDADAITIAAAGAVTFSQRDVHSSGITIADGGQIGSASDADSIAIAANGVVTFSQAPVFPDGSIALVDLDIDGGTDIGEALADADLFVVDNGAGGTNRKTEASRIKTYIADVTLTTAAQTNITSLGTLTTLTVDDITINGSTISDSGDLTLDIGGDIVLDAGGEQVIFKDGSTNVGHVDLSSDNLTLKSLVSDKDFIVKGNDGGTEITALTIDMSAAGAATFNNNVTAFSDERLKSNIQTIESGLSKVEQLRGVTYVRDDIKGGGQQLGVIAQEVEKILPQVVLTAKDEMKTKSVDYGRLTGVLIEAVKELSARVKELESK